MTREEERERWKIQAPFKSVLMRLIIVCFFLLLSRLALVPSGMHVHGQIVRVATGSFLNMVKPAP